MSLDKCRVCGEVQTNPSECPSLSKMNPAMVKNWLQQVFNVELEVLDREGFPTIICWTCIETAKKINGFARKSAQMNGLDFPKQEWWEKLQNPSSK